MIVDLHAHYPMHVGPSERRTVLDLLGDAPGRWRLLDFGRAALISLASRLANYRSFDSGPRVTVPLLRSGGVGVCLSVLYSATDEMDPTKRWPSLPAPSYFDTLIRQLDDVEAELGQSRGLARLVTSPADIDAAIADGEVAVIHCVEGGFHLGPTLDEADRNVADLAARGIAYITVAHLFWRGYATNTNAIPFLGDRIYDLLFPQPGIGLSDLGAAAVRAMHREGILIDLSHCSPRAFDDILDLLDELDPERATPVMATHVSCRFGAQLYNVSDEQISRIAERHGVIGMILAEHQAADGAASAHTSSVDESLALLAKHIDHIRELSGSHRNTAIGTDLDGFIKPTLNGLDDAGRLQLLERGLRERYGDTDAELICSGNALRVLRAGWRGSG